MGHDGGETRRIKGISHGDLPGFLAEQGEVAAGIDETLLDAGGAQHVYGAIDGKTFGDAAEIEPAARSNGRVKCTPGSLAQGGGGGKDLDGPRMQGNRAAGTLAIEPAQFTPGFLKAHEPVNRLDSGEGAIDRRVQSHRIRAGCRDLDISAEQRPRAPNVSAGRGHGSPARV